jgi:hypothetical protein
MGTPRTVGSVGVVTIERMGGVDGRSPAFALGTIEAGRLLRHPVTIWMAILAVAFTAFLHAELATDVGAWYQALTGLPLVVLSLGMPILGVLVGSRSWHDRTVELYASDPVTDGLRSGAQILAFGLLAGIATAAVAVGWVATRAWGGLPVFFDESTGVWRDIPLGVSFPTARVAPSLPELLQGPAAVFVMGLAGIALGRWVPTRWTIVALFPAVLAYWIVVSWGVEGEARWFLPFVNAAQEIGWVTTNADGSGVGIVQGYNAAAIGWHLVYLLGVSTVLGGLLVGRIRRRGTQLAVGIGVAVAVVGGVAQLVTYVPNLPT